MKLYVLYGFDKLMYYQKKYYIDDESEIVYIFTDKDKAFKCVRENGNDFQDGAYNYCAICECKSESYLPMYENCENTFFKYDRFDKVWKTIK